MFRVTSTIGSSICFLTNASVTLILAITLIICSACNNDDSDNYTPTSTPLTIPQLFQERLLPPIVPADNPQTAEGIALGKRLFFDRILSVDGTVSCASCHAPRFAFSDTQRLSLGVNNLKGERNSMPIFNAAWNFEENFFWDDRAFSLEHQALFPIRGDEEMNNTWTQVAATLQAHPEYPGLFQAAFGTETIDSTLVTKAIAQFQRTLISANSRFDQHERNEIQLAPLELEGLNVFMAEDKGDCFHCHGSPANPLWTDNIFHNNGLDATFTDRGLGAISGNPADDGKFKTPSLRNLAFTAPYMHDGRFATLDQVIDHYSEGLVNSPTIDPLMKSVNQGGVQLSAQDKAALKAFLLSLSDMEFINNPEFQQP